MRGRGHETRESTWHVLYKLEKTMTRTGRMTQRALLQNKGDDSAFLQMYCIKAPGWVCNEGSQNTTLMM